MADKPVIKRTRIVHIKHSTAVKRLTDTMSQLDVNEIAKLYSTYVDSHAITRIENSDRYVQGEVTSDWFGAND